MLNSEWIKYLQKIQTSLVAKWVKDINFLQLGKNLHSLFKFKEHRFEVLCIPDLINCFQIIESYLWLMDIRRLY